MREERIERFLALADKEPEELSDEEERELAQLAEEMRCEIRSITHTL
jgi:hypothetical protein